MPLAQILKAIPGLSSKKQCAGGGNGPAYDSRYCPPRRSSATRAPGPLHLTGSVGPAREEAGGSARVPLGRITVRLHIAFGGVRATPRALADEVAEAGPPTREMTAAAAAAAVRILTVLNMIGFIPLLARSCR